MKRIVVAVLISMTLFAAITGCGKGADIGKEKATDIALGDAQLSESDVTRLRVSKERDDGQSIYEVRLTEISSALTMMNPLTGANSLQVDSKGRQINRLKTGSKDRQTRSLQMDSKGRRINRLRMGSTGTEITDLPAMHRIHRLMYCLRWMTPPSWHLTVFLGLLHRI